jgi:predicted nuclease with RNAse H fold
VVITAGVDLATEPERTALATIDWSAGAAAVREVSVGVTDAEILSAVRDVDKLGIDCPLGWPDEFVEFFHQHHQGHAAGPEDVAGRDWRRRLAYRTTDRAVRAAIGLQPLSVAADRIGLTAMRAASLLGHLAADGRPVDRSGRGIVAEVYPAASLRCWDLPYRGYKRDEGSALRARLVVALTARAPWLDLGRHQQLCLDSDDALDAVVAALTSRAAALSLVATPNPDQVDSARREGWIMWPTCTLEALGETGPPLA